MITLASVSKQYGEKILFKDANFQLKPGEKVGLVGPNGAGKTTIFRLITGEERADGGAVTYPDKTSIAYFSQNVGEMRGRSVLEEVMATAGKLSVLKAEIDKIEARLQDCETNPLDDDAMAKLLERYGEYQLEFEQRGGYELEPRAKEILTGLGFPPEDHGRPVESYSGGWKMRVKLASILLQNPDVLLMDEPTNHLDLESIVWLENWLMTFKGAVIMTSHDRDFMNRLVSRIIEIANKTVTVYTGNYDFYERESKIRKEQLLAAASRQEDMLAKEQEFIARFAARASHAAQVQSRVKKLEKIDRIEIPAEERVMDFEFPPAPRSGNDIVRLDKLGKTWTLEDGRQKLVFRNASGTVKRLDRIAVVGVNGAGKSTLLKIIAGQTEGTEGTATLGASLKIGYFSQHSLEVLNGSNTIFEELHNRIPDATIGYIRNLCGAFLFSGDEVHKKISVLSGGEKSRVVLATLLCTPLNFLILDEPTNHLDIKSREMLLKALLKFDGTIMMVSHDRHFLRSLANRVFELDKGELRVYEGDYQYYLSKRTH